MTRPLEGRTIALAEGRQLEELVGLLEKEGAVTIRCPMVSILDAPDGQAVIAWLHELMADQLSWVILFTGEGVRRLLGFAERDGRRDAAIAAMGRTRILTRGPKPVQALKEVGLSPTRVAESPTTEGVIASLRHEDLPGKVVGVQLYAPTNPPLIQFLESIGAKVRTVLPYIYAPASDAARVAELIEQMARGEVEVVVFTSSPQVDRLFEVAEQRGMHDMLKRGLARTQVAAIGPVVADRLTQGGVVVAICPEQGFVMKNLVRHIQRAIEGGNR